MIHSLTFFISERRGNSRIKNYLKYIILFPISYLLFFISYALFFELIHIIDYIINKIFNYKLIDLPNIYYSIIIFIIVPILYIILYIKIMKKYFSFNDINLFFIINAIITFIIMNTGDIKGEGFYYTLIIYYIFFYTIVLDTIFHQYTRSIQ